MNPIQMIARAAVCLWLAGFTVVFAEPGEILEYSYGENSLKISGLLMLHGDESDEEIGATIAKDIGDKVPVKGKSEIFTYEYAGTWSRDPETQKFVPDFIPVPRTFSITYNLPEGSSAGDWPTSYTYGNSVDLPQATLSGWKFVNWMGELALVDHIMAGEFGNKTFMAIFSRPVLVFTGVDSVEVEIWQIDSDSAIDVKINKYVSRYDVEVIPVDRPKHKDSSYTVAHWQADEDGVYNPVFEVKYVAPEEIPIVVVGDLEGNVVMDTLVILSTDEDSVISRKISGALAENEIQVPEKPEDENYYYSLTGWKKNSSKGWYEPVIDSVVKPKIVKAIYGGTRKEFIWVDVVMTDSEEDIARKIDVALKDNFFEATKASDNLFLYEMVGWVNVGNDTYVPNFRAISKPASARVVYDVETGSYVTIVIRATDTGSDIEKNIERALGDKPMPSMSSSEKYDYTFCGWNKDLVDGQYVFTPDFDSSRVEEKKESEDAVRVRGGFADMQFSLDGRTLEIAGTKEGSRILVFDMHGRRVLEQTVAGFGSRVEFPRAGSYVIRAGGEVRRFTVK